MPAIVCDDLIVVRMSDADQHDQARADPADDAPVHTDLGPRSRAGGAAALRLERVSRGPRVAIAPSTRRGILTACTSRAVSRPRWNSAEPTTHTSAP